MTFGTDLKDQIPSILDYVGEGISSLQQFRSFIKDKSSIEREYAQKLESLTKKYKPGKKSANTNMDAQDDWDWEDTSSTTASAWCQLLNQTSMVAKTRLRLVDDLNVQVAESLRLAAVRKEEAKKKHTAFYQKLKAERDKTYAEKDKAKQLYDDACAEIENLKAKTNKSSGDREKHQRQLDAALIDCDNKKNLYLLAISVANAERAKYFEEDMPVLADHLEELDASRTLTLKAILRHYISLESQLLTTVQKCHDDVLTTVEKIDPLIDASVFTRNALNTEDVNEKAANVAFSFMPWNGGANAADTIIDRDDSLVASDSAIIFLNNKLVKNRKQLNTLGDDLSKKSSELSQLNLADNKASPDYDKSKEKMMELEREITLLSTQKVRVKSELDLIIQNIGDDGLRAQNHDFKSSSFTIPTTCDFCNSTIWGLSNKGLTCKACGFNCHTKCEMKVAPNCSKVKGQLNPQPTPSSFVSSSIRTRSINNDSSFSTESFSSTSPPPPISAPPTSIPSMSAPPTSIPPTSAMPDIRSLYDYDAQNEDELSIKEGDLLSTIDPDDGSGWIKAQLGNTVGLIPATYVEQLTENNHQKQAQEAVVVLYDFEAVNVEELNMHEGDIIYVTKKDDSGWWEGILNGQKGIFPSNYVQPK